MIGRIIEIASEGCHLARHRGFMTVAREGEELGRTPLDDISAVICTAHGITYSNSLIAELGNRNALVVVCGSNFLPVAWLWPVSGHHAQAEKMRYQIEAPAPLRKRLWQHIVRAKIAQQAAALKSLGKPAARLDQFAKAVKSGDITNVEAQAARYYWPMIFGENFRRDRSAGGINGLLNYGYTVMRSSVARAVTGAGLHPTIAVHHSNRSNAFALVDDLLEVFRPIVDLTAYQLCQEGRNKVDTHTKAALARLTHVDLPTKQGTTPLQTCCDRLAKSLAQCFESGKSDQLDLPLAPYPLELRV